MEKMFVALPTGVQQLCEAHSISLSGPASAPPAHFPASIFALTQRSKASCTRR